MKFDLKKTAKVIIPILIAIISIFVVAEYASSPETHIHTITALDEKKTTVMELTAASTAASVAITAIPGDIGTPIAEKIVDLSSCFLIVLCALYLEKYLATITGYVTFVVLIPVACALIATNVFLKNDTVTALAKKLAIFGMAIILVIPASVKVSEVIEHTYSVSMEATIEAAKEEVETETVVEEETTFWDKLVDDIKDTVVTTKEGAEQKLNQFIEAIAIMLVTTCLIPVLVIFFFIWLIKIILGVNITIPKKQMK